MLTKIYGVARYLGILKRLIHERLRLQSAKEGTEADDADCDGPGEVSNEIKEILSNAPPLPGPSLLLPLQVESMVQHKFVILQCHRYDGMVELHRLLFRCCFVLQASIFFPSCHVLISVSPLRF